MITLIHGDDIVSSRNYYKSLQKNDSETLEGEKITIAVMEEIVQSNGLFGDEKHITIENFFSKRKASKEMEQIIAVINGAQKHATFLFWESKELTKKTIDQFPNAQVKTFTIPKSLFQFMDSMKPGNTDEMLRLYHQTLAYTDAEMVLVMLIRQIRILLAISDRHSSDSIEEVKRMAPWQQKKFLSQAKHFSQEQLINVHTNLFDLEVKSKTGGLVLPLSQSIDFFLSTI